MSWRSFFLGLTFGFIVGTSSIVVFQNLKDNIYKEPVVNQQPPVIISSYPKSFNCFIAPCLELCKIAPGYMETCEHGPKVVDVSEIGIIAPKSSCCVDRFDPWGNSFYVDCSGAKTYVFSAGLDGVEDTEDDVKCSCDNSLYKGK